LRATYGVKNLGRLREIKAKYDPERVFRSSFAWEGVGEGASTE